MSGVMIIKICQAQLKGQVNCMGEIYGPII